MGINGINQQNLMFYNQRVNNNFTLANSYANTPVFTSNNQTIIGDSFNNQTVTPKDGKDDGSIGFFGALGNLFKGVGNFFKGMVCDENGKFSITRTLTTLGVGAAIGAACAFLPTVAIAGTTFSTLGLISVGFLGFAGLHAGKSAINIMSAKTDVEAEQAWQEMGSALTEGGLAYLGYRASGGIFAKDTVAPTPSGSTPKSPKTPKATTEETPVEPTRTSAPKAETSVEEPVVEAPKTENYTEEIVAQEKVIVDNEKLLNQIDNIVSKNKYETPEVSIIEDRAILPELREGSFAEMEDHILNIGISSNKGIKGGHSLQTYTRIKSTITSTLGKLKNDISGFIKENLNLDVESVSQMQFDGAKPSNFSCKATLKDGSSIDIVIKDNKITTVTDSTGKRILDIKSDGAKKIYLEYNKLLTKTDGLRNNTETSIKYIDTDADGHLIFGLGDRKLIWFDKYGYTDVKNLELHLTESQIGDITVLKETYYLKGKKSKYNTGEKDSNNKPIIEETPNATEETYPLEISSRPKTLIDEKYLLEIENILKQSQETNKLVLTYKKTFINTDNGKISYRYYIKYKDNYYEICIANEPKGSKLNTIYPVTVKHLTNNGCILDRIPKWTPEQLDCAA